MTTTSDSDEKHIMCVRCRNTFSDSEIQAHVELQIATLKPDEYTGCPSCGSKDVPADTRARAAIDLTWHEWQIVFWWASGHLRVTGAEAYQPILDSIVNEVRRQHPTAPSLSLIEELKDMAARGHQVTLMENGKETQFEKRTLN